MIFDGRAEAKKIEEELIRSTKLTGKSLLIIQADGADEESTYVMLKRQMGESLGTKVKLQITNSKSQLIDLI